MNHRPPSTVHRPFFLGLDVGASKTHALIADEKGQALGFGAGGAGNHQAVGYDGLRSVLQHATAQALKMAGLKIEQISGAGFGIGGYDWPSQLQAHLDVIAALGLDCPLEAVNDALIGLFAGTSEGWGLALVGGTGCNCRGRDRQGREGRVTGEGGRFGEYGGGGELVVSAIQAVSHEWSRRGPATMLTNMFLELTAAKNLDDLIEGIDLGYYEPSAAWALAVFQAAYGGDEVAREVISWNGRELGELGCAVIRQLELENEAVEIVEIGSLFDGGALFVDAVHETISKVAPKARLIRLEAPPVVGGVILGMQKAGLDTRPIRQRLIETTQSLCQFEG